MTEIAPRIALLPLDERPVNLLLPQDVSRIAGVILDTPPADLLPIYREPGNPEALGEWLMQRARDPATVHLVVSLDMLLYGGLIASRTSADSQREVLARLDLLRQIRAVRPDLAISAVSLVMRASNSYSAVEEPAYWADYGKELHALGGTIHSLSGQSSIAPLAEITPVPADVVADYASRRIRNHVVNLNALLLLQDHTLDFLAITADDTATLSAGSAEQDWLRHWMRFLPAGRSVLMYPGADEVGAALVARALTASIPRPVTFTVACADDGGLDRVPPFENQPLSESVQRQVRAAGAEVVESGADVVLVVHAPDPDRHDMFNGYPGDGAAAAVEATVAMVESELAAGRAVALADVRYPNGSHAALLWRLAEQKLLERLTAFGGWNTAGNTLGSVVAVAVATVVGVETGRVDRHAIRQALLTRLLDDFVYQSVIRSEDGATLFPDHRPMADDGLVAAAELAIAGRMREVLSASLPAGDWTLSSLRLPWRRSFEVEIGLERRAAR
jgi:hypothetical protein